MTEHNREPQPGDLVWADRIAKGLPYNHCGIYEGAGYVIHFAAPSGMEISSENAVVHRATFERFQDGCQVKVLDVDSRFTPEETLRRARSCMGHRGYNFATFNCDHFATWCKTGEYRSIQVDDVKTVLREMDNPVADIVCDIHDIAEKINAPRLDAVYPERESEILGNIETNAYITESIPPTPGDDSDVAPEYEVISKDEVGDYPTLEPYNEDVNDAVVDDEDEDGPPPPPKKPWYEKVGDFLKGITYPITLGLEFLKKKVPILMPIPFLSIGAKVRNVIDNVVTTIKVATGRMTKEEALQERMNNETALAGAIVQQKQRHPIINVIKTVFGKVGSAVKHVAQQVVARIVPAPIRNFIKTGFQKTVGAIVTGVKNVVKKVGEGIKGFFGKVKQFLFG